MKSSLILLAFFIELITLAQYAPMVGVSGTTAIHCQSASFVDWAYSCTVHRGFINISDTSVTDMASNKASYGDEINATLKADNLSVSLGDGGMATLEFNSHIIDGPGFDFAVFENAFMDDFLELAFVEVSSDGLHFVRFPSASLTSSASQKGAFDRIDAQKINNLAGKYRTLYGTPFDLSVLDTSSVLDMKNITHIRIIDVVGNITFFSSFDASGNIINDPWPTPFYSCGFDLDAVGILNNLKSIESIQDYDDVRINIWPIPAYDFVNISLSKTTDVCISVSNILGNTIYQNRFTTATIPKIDVSSWPCGMYFFKIQKDGKSFITKVEKK